MIEIITPSRLHFCLIDLNGSIGRIDGSIGLAIDQPSFHLIARRSEKVEICSENYTDRAHQIIEKLRQKFDFSGIEIKFISEIPTHSGFGSGTQLSLSIATAINRLYDLDQSVRDLAITVGRGGTSGIGVTAFENGGLIVDGGHRFPDQKSVYLPSAAAGNVPPPPLLIRRDFPDWKILIVVPNCEHISGETEKRIFQTLCPQPLRSAERLSHLILMKILPSIFENDLHAFGSAINEIQTFGWKKVEINAQGKILQKTLDFLIENGAIGAGVSSWGPAIFAVSEAIDELYEKAKIFLKNDLQIGGSCFITQANNCGAKINDR